MSLVELHNVFFYCAALVQQSIIVNSIKWFFLLIESFTNTSQKQLLYFNPSPECSSDQGRTQGVWRPRLILFSVPIPLLLSVICPFITFPCSFFLPSNVNIQLARSFLFFQQVYNVFELTLNLNELNYLKILSFILILF